MALFRYVHLVIDTHPVSTATSIDVLAERLKNVASSILATFRDLPGDNGDGIPMKWVYKFFDSRIAQIPSNMSTSKATMSLLTSESLSVFSDALIAELTLSLLLNKSENPLLLSSSATSVSPGRSKAQRRQSQELTVIPTTFSSYFENVQYSVSNACQESSDWIMAVEDRDRDVLSASRSSEENWSNNRLKRSESFFFLLSPCPKSLVQLMRSLERPEDMLKTMADPLFNESGAIAYAKPKLRTILTPFVEPFKLNRLADRIYRFSWIDTRDWVFESIPPSTTLDLTHQYFGEWGRIGDSRSKHECEKGLLQVSELLMESGIGIFHVSSFNSLMHLVWPSQVIHHLFVAPLELKRPRTSAIWMHCGAFKFRLTLESIYSPSSPSVSPKSLHTTFKIPQQALLSLSWTCSWIATTAWNEDWKSLLSDLVSTHTTLVACDVPSELLCIVCPIGLDTVQIIQLDWDQNLIASLKMASHGVQSTSDGLLLVEPHGHLIRKSLRRTYHALSSSLPEKSVMDVFSVFRLSEAPEADTSNIPKDKMDPPADFNAITSAKSLVFAADPPNPELFQREIPIAHLASPNSFQSRIPSSPRASLGLDQFSLDHSRVQATEIPLATIQIQTIISALHLYLSDLYATYLTGILPSSPTFAHDPEVQAAYGWFPLPIAFHAPTIPQPPPSSSSSIEFSLLQKLSQLSSIMQQHGWQTHLLDLLEHSMLLSPAMLRDKYLPSSVTSLEGSSAKVPPTEPGNGKEDTFASFAHQPRISTLEATDISNEVKLTEYRIQVMLRMVVWKLRNGFPVLVPSSASDPPNEDENTMKINGSEIAELNSGNKKLEMEEKARKDILALIEVIGFILSSTADIHALTSYFNDLISMTMREMPNLALWLKKKLDLEESYETPSHLVLDLSSARQTISSRQPYHLPTRSGLSASNEGVAVTNSHSSTQTFLPSQFLIHLVDSTSNILLDTRSPVVRSLPRPTMTSSVALALLTASASSNASQSPSVQHSTQTEPEDDISPRRHSSKRTLNDDAVERVLEGAPSSKRMAL